MTDLYDRVIGLCKRRGFLYPSFEIYEGAGGFYDWGPMGASLKRKTLDKWRQLYVVKHGFMEVYTPTVMPEEVFEASGHLDGFVDPMISCEECGESYRADHLVESFVEVVADSMPNEELEEIIEEEDLGCPECGGGLSDVYDFNLMFGTTVGPGRGRQGYLRPETAQGIFVSYPRLHRYARESLPFGVVQIGRAYRNEVSPRQGVIRLREFSQAEVELFVDPEEKNHEGFGEIGHKKVQLLSAEAQLEGGNADIASFRNALSEGLLDNELFAYHLHEIDRFLRSLGIPEVDIRWRQHLPDERAHYAADCWDAEVRLDRFGWIEVVGLADRTDYDLSKHTSHSGRDLDATRRYDEPREEKRRILDVDMASLGPRLKDRAPEAVRMLESLPEGDLEGSVTLEVDGQEVEIREDEYEVVEETVEVRGEEFTPHVVEPSYGVDRILYASLEKAFHVEEVEGRERRVLKLPREVAPVDVAVLPLMDRGDLNRIADRIAGELREKGLVSEVDGSGNIGRRYRRQDEIGTPLAVTVDPEGLEDRTVTLRDRDTMDQVRVPISKVPEAAESFLGGRGLGSLGE